MRPKSVYVVLVENIGFYLHNDGIRTISLPVPTHSLLRGILQYRGSHWF